MEINERIKQDANEIIKSLYKKNGNELKANIKWRFKNEPVNWGDLKCLAVEQKYVVYVGEAAPTANWLKDYLKTELEKRGHKNVEIVTEW